MTIHKIRNTAGQTIAFRGTRFASEDSIRVETGHGAVLYHIDAYDRDSGGWVLVITAKRRELTCDEITEYVSTDRYVDAEDFLYDFDPSRVLAGAVLAAPNVPKHRSLIDAADRAYHSLARRVSHRLGDRYRKQKLMQQRHPGQSVPAAEPKLARQDRMGIVNRIRHLFRID